MNNKNLIKDKNLTYTNEAKNTKIKSISDLLVNKKEKDNENNEDIKPSISFDGEENEVKKIKINTKMKNMLNNLEEEKSQKSQSNDENNNSNNNFFKEDNVSEDAKKNKE